MLHRYETTKEQDGSFIIHDVPIFAEISRDIEIGDSVQTMKYDEDWINTAVEEAKRRETQQHHKPVLYIEHNRDGKSIREIAGFLVNQRAHTIQYDGKPTRTVYADLVITLPEVFEEIKKGQFPGISVEIKDSQENNPQTFTAAALLNSEPPALKFDPLLVKEPKNATERPKSFMEARKTGATFEVVCFSEFPRVVRKFAEEKLLDSEIGMDRQDMPQFKGKDFDKLLKDLEEEGIKTTQGEITATLLKPTQEDLDTEKVKAIKKEGKELKPILVSSDLFILDGHHRWASKGDGVIEIIKIDLPIKELLRRTEEFGEATTIQEKHAQKNKGKIDDPQKAKLIDMLEWSNSYFNSLTDDLIRARHERRTIREQILKDVLTAFNLANGHREKIGLKPIELNRVFRQTKKGLEFTGAPNNLLLEGVKELNIASLPTEGELEIIEDSKEKKQREKDIEKESSSVSGSKDFPIVRKDGDVNTPEGLPKLVSYKGKKYLYDDKEDLWFAKDNTFLSPSSLAEKVFTKEAKAVGQNSIIPKRSVAFAEDNTDALLEEVNSFLTQHDFAEPQDKEALLQQIANLDAKAEKAEAEGDKKEMNRLYKQSVFLEQKLRELKSSDDFSEVDDLMQQVNDLLLTEEVLLDIDTLEPIQPQDLYLIDDESDVMIDIDTLKEMEFSENKRTYKFAEEPLPLAQQSRDLIREMIDEYNSGNKNVVYRLADEIETYSSFRDDVYKAITGGDLESTLDEDSDNIEEVLEKEFKLPSPDDMFLSLNKQVNEINSLQENILSLIEEEKQRLGDYAPFITMKTPQGKVDVTEDILNSPESQEFKAIEPILIDASEGYNDFFSEENKQILIEKIQKNIDDINNPDYNAYRSDYKDTYSYLVDEKEDELREKALEQIDQDELREQATEDLKDDIQSDAEIQLEEEIEKGEVEEDDRDSRLQEIIDEITPEKIQDRFHELLDEKQDKVYRELYDEELEWYVNDIMKNDASDAIYYIEEPLRNLVKALEEDELDIENIQELAKEVIKNKDNYAGYFGYVIEEVEDIINLPPSRSMIEGLLEELEEKKNKYLEEYLSQISESIEEMNPSNASTNSYAYQTGNNFKDRRKGVTAKPEPIELDPKVLSEIQKLETKINDLNQKHFKFEFSESRLDEIERELMAFGELEEKLKLQKEWEMTGDPSAKAKLDLLNDRKTDKLQEFQKKYEELVKKAQILDGDRRRYLYDRGGYYKDLTREEKYKYDSMANEFAYLSDEIRRTYGKAMTLRRDLGLQTYFLGDITPNQLYSGDASHYITKEFGEEKLPLQKRTLDDMAWEIADNWISIKRNILSSKKFNWLVNKINEQMSNIDPKTGKHDGGEVNISPDTIASWLRSIPFDQIIELGRTIGFSEEFAQKKTRWTEIEEKEKNELLKTDGLKDRNRLKDILKKLDNLKEKHQDFDKFRKSKYTEQYKLNLTDKNNLFEKIIKNTPTSVSDIDDFNRRREQLNEELEDLDAQVEGYHKVYDSILAEADGKDLFSEAEDILYKYGLLDIDDTMDSVDVWYKLVQKTANLPKLHINYYDRYLKDFPSPESDSAQTTQGLQESLLDQLDRLEKEAYVALDKNDDEETFYAKLEEANELLKEYGYGGEIEVSLDADDDVIEGKHTPWREFMFGEIPPQKPFEDEIAADDAIIQMEKDLADEALEYTDESHAYMLGFDANNEGEALEDTTQAMDDYLDSLPKKLHSQKIEEYKRGWLDADKFAFDNPRNAYEFGLKARREGNQSEASEEFLDYLRGSGREFLEEYPSYLRGFKGLRFSEHKNKGY